MFHREKYTEKASCVSGLCDHVLDTPQTPHNVRGRTPGAGLHAPAHKGPARLHGRMCFTPQHCFLLSRPLASMGGRGGGGPVRQGRLGPGSISRCPRCRRGAGRAARVPLVRFGPSEGGAALGQRGAAVGAGRSTSVCRPSITTGTAAATTSPTGTEARAPPPPSTPPPGHTRAPTVPASTDKGSAVPREATRRGGGVIERTSGELLSE